jgi:HAMP domain-containing protein
MHYLLAGKVEDKQKYKEMGVIVRKVQAEWVDAAKESMALGLSRKGEMEKSEEIARAYNKAEETVAAAFESLDGGKRLEAYRLLEDKVEFWIDRVLSKKLDEAVAKANREANEAYDEVLIRLGSIPWGGKNSIELVQNTRFSMQSFIAVDKISSGIRKEYKEVIDFLVSGEERDMKELEEHAGEAEAALKDWIMAIQVQTELGRNKRRELLNNAMEMDKKHGALMELAHKAFELERAGKREELSGFIENKIKPYVNDLLLSQLSRERDHIKKEIDNANQKLLDITFAAGVKAVVMLTIVSLIIIVVIISIMRGIMISLNKLRVGTEIIGTGILEHRIGLKAKDELGQLASAFDRMTGYRLKAGHF